MDYEAACAAATTRQGLDPIVAHFGDTVTVEQTGGFTMVGYVRAPNGDPEHLGITHGFVEGGTGFLVVAYANDDDDGTILDEDAPLDHVADYVRGFLRAHGGPA